MANAETVAALAAGAETAAHDAEMERAVIVVAASLALSGVAYALALPACCIFVGEKLTQLPEEARAEAVARLCDLVRQRAGAL